jgi:NAD(P)-dependent dehydrogenase (short-subunit alcohol dehydrogenase family)
VDAVAAELDGLDVFVNNAGWGHTHPFLEFPLEDWQRVLDLNLTGAFACAQRAGRIMVESETSGRIVNITSVHEHIPLRGAAAYCAAKGGLGLLTKVMALELAEHGITVNAVAPGEIATPMTGAHDEDPSEEDRPGLPAKRPGNAHEVAEMVAVLARPDARYTTGTSIVVDGGLMLTAAEFNRDAARS